jgi:hypothetical protein
MVNMGIRFDLVRPVLLEGSHSVGRLCRLVRMIASPLGRRMWRFPDRGIWRSPSRRALCAYPIALRERPSPDATFYPARRRSAYNGAAAFRGKLPPKTCLGNPTASRHNGQSSPLGLLPPADFGGTPTPDP